MLLPSTAGRLFREFGGVLAAAVIISSFVALSLVPALTARLPLKEEKQANKLQQWGGKLRDGYAKTLHFALDKAWWVFIACTLIAISAVWSYSNVDSELMPSEDRGTIRIFARGLMVLGLILWTAKRGKWKKFYCHTSTVAMSIVSIQP